MSYGHTLRDPAHLQSRGIFHDILISSALEHS